MEYNITTLSQSKKNKRAICLGFFDGIHKGHQKLISQCLQYRKECRTCLLSFDQSPKNRQQNLMSKSTKIKMLKNMKLNELITLNFSKIKDWTPLVFVDFLIDELNVSYLICGSDFRFAKNAEGDVQLLAKLINNRAKLIIIPNLVINKENVSTSLIIDYLKQGKIKQANYRLGYDYFIEGKVERGLKIGRKLLVATANINYDKGLFLPKTGVYASWVKINNQMLVAVTNIGVNPSINGDNSIKIEVHILGFSGNIYDKAIKCYPIKYLRSEKRYENLSDLKKQISKDIEKTKKITLF